MRQKPGRRKSHGEKVVKDIRRATRKQYSAEEKIRIVLDGLKGEDSIAELCRREGIEPPPLKWSAFMFKKRWHPRGINRLVALRYAHWII